MMMLEPPTTHSSDAAFARSHPHFGRTEGRVVSHIPMVIGVTLFGGMTLDAAEAATEGIMAGVKGTDRLENVPPVLHILDVIAVDMQRGALGLTAAYALYATGKVVKRVRAQRHFRAEWDAARQL